MPKRGDLNTAGKRQENATFLQFFFDVALQLVACCSAIFGQNDLTSPDPPESVEHHMCVWKIETEKKNLKNPLNSSVILQFSQVSQIFEKSEKIVRIRPHKYSYCGKQGVLFFGFRPNSSVFVRFWKIEKSDFPFFSHFLEVHLWRRSQTERALSAFMLSPQNVQKLSKKCDLGKNENEKIKTKNGGKHERKNGLWGKRNQVWFYQTRRKGCVDGKNPSQSPP